MVRVIIGRRGVSSEHRRSSCSSFSWQNNISRDKKCAGVDEYAEVGVDLKTRILDLLGDGQSFTWGIADYHVALKK